MEPLKCGTFGQDMNFVVSQVIHRQLLVLQLAQMDRDYLFGVETAPLRCGEFNFSR